MTKQSLDALESQQTREIFGRTVDLTVIQYQNSISFSSEARTASTINTSFNYNSYINDNNQIYSDN